MVLHCLLRDGPRTVSATGREAVEPKANLAAAGSGHPYRGNRRDGSTLPIDTSPWNRMRIQTGVSLKPDLTSTTNANRWPRNRPAPVGAAGPDLQPPAVALRRLPPNR